MSFSLPVLLWYAAGAGLGLAAGDVTSTGPNLDGIAAIIAASAGMVSAVGAIILGLRSKHGSESDLEKEILMKLLKEQLEQHDDPDVTP